jgi:NapC/NirT cytochrome c family protein/cytochrome c7-like protein
MKEKETRKKQWWKLSRRKVVLLVVLIFILSSGGFVVVSSRPGFCNSCHIMEPYYASWQTSTHSEVNCLDCHIQPGFAGLVKGKINGLAQAVDCMVGRMGTKPNATIYDESCLRQGCHSVEELTKEPVEYKKFRFTHQGHLNAEVDGIKITCGLCHSHHEGEDHFNVNPQSCFVCHFLKSPQTETRLVDTKCQSCHDVPAEPVKRGEVEVDHAEFVAFEASCEQSCHKKQIVTESEVEGSTCLSCHAFRKPNDIDSKEMHHAHSQGHKKVECFSCHGEINHTSSMGVAMATMLDCQSCHSNTHEVQRQIYSALEKPDMEKTHQFLKPMFFAHVECKGCHIESTEVRPGVLNSLGTVAKAVPEACDHCHGQGYGEKYVPFWQKQTKQLFEKVSTQVEQFEQKIANTMEKSQAEQMTETAKQARLILEAVVNDGSWGVHNLKYTEMMLLKAKNLVSE